MRSQKITVTDGLALHINEYGAPTDQLPLICLPGLTRNAMDFDDLANVVHRDRQVFAMDLRGRGHSDYDSEWRHYVPPTYVRDVIEVMDALSVERAVFCGTSLGGLVTMLLAQATPQRVAGAILNDIGPVIEADGLARIQQYTGMLPCVNTWAEATEQVRTIYAASLPGLSEEQWQRLVERSFRESESGQPVLDFDPNIGRAIREVDMQLGDPWLLFDALKTIPALVLRGATSDILSEATVDAMQQRNATLQRATIADRGHAPLLNEPDSIAAITNFLGALP